MNGDETEVVISDGNSYVKLVPVGQPRLGYPTRIEISSGSFSATVEAETRIDPIFRQALSKLHKTLSGEAILTCWSQEHSVTLTGNGVGRIDLIAKITDGRSPWSACLVVKMQLDQSYLPEIIAGIDRNFSPPS